MSAVKDMAVFVAPGIVISYMCHQLYKYYFPLNIKPNITIIVYLVFIVG